MSACVQFLDFFRLDLGSQMSGKLMQVLQELGRRTFVPHHLSQRIQLSVGIHNSFLAPRSRDEPTLTGMVPLVYFPGSQRQLAPAQLLLWVPTVRGYSLKLQEWCHFSVSEIRTVGEESRFGYWVFGRRSSTLACSLSSAEVVLHNGPSSDKFDST